MRLKSILFNYIFLTYSIVTAQIVYDLENDDQQSIINAISSLGMVDDQVGMANAPIITADLNNNGILDYITAQHAADFVYIYFDQSDFTDELYYPHEGPSLIITGALHLGSSFTSGDFNGDNIDDLLIGAKSEGGDGEAFVIFGSSSLPTTGTSTINSLIDVRLSFSGFSGNNDLFGAQVCAADLNNDGFDEIIIGATVAWYQGDGSGRGSVYIIYGSSSLPSVIQARTESDIIIEGNEPFDHIGKYLKKGDFNNDNFDDLVFTSAYWPGAGANGQRGKAWILFGNNSLPSYFNINQTYSQISGFAGQNQNDEMAYASAGDINGDGIDDLILCAGKFDAPVYPATNNFGKVYINYGPIQPGQDYSDVESFSNQTQIFPHPEDLDYSHTYMYIGSHFGQSISTMDINNDGFDDLLIGAPGYSRWPSTGSQTNEGGAFIILGSSSLDGVIYEESQYAQFIAENGPYNPNQSFGRAVNFITTNNDNKVYASICDVEESLIYLFDLGIDSPPEGETVFVESFEGDIEGWEAYDNDSDGNTWGVFEDPEAAHSGNKGVGVQWNPNGNDDWLVTPQITLPEADEITFTFWSRSYTSTYLEDFNIKLSTTGNSIADFSVNLGSVTDAPDSWTLYEYDLSDYENQSIFLALQCVSVDEYYLFADDFLISSQTLSINTSNEPIPSDYSMYQNYPNPFNPLTTISYSIPEMTDVNISIFNITGQLVETLVKEEKEPGYHSVVWYPKNVSSGLYIYKLKVGDKTLSKKMILVK